MNGRLSRDQVLMGTAHLFAQRGTCARAQVGAVISWQGRILSTGFNGAPSGMEHCYHASEIVLSPDTDVPHRVFTEKGGCQVSVHAEANAVAWAARYGIRVVQAEIHTTVSPCIACAQLLINAGIQRVIYEEPYRDAAGINLLYRAGIKVEQFNGQ